MTKANNATGEFFERRVKASLPVKDFRDCDDAPDFRLANIWLEAKVSFDRSDYGCKPKEYQFELHSKFSPFVYLLGFHDFVDSEMRLRGKPRSERLALLEGEANITRAYLVSASAVERMWFRDCIQNKKGTISYLQISAENIEQIITDQEAKRRGTKVNIREYYGIGTDEYDFLSATPLHGIPIGFILEKNIAQTLIELVERNGKNPIFNVKTPITEQLKLI